MACGLNAVAAEPSGSAASKVHRIPPRRFSLRAHWALFGAGGSPFHGCATALMTGHLLQTLGFATGGSVRMAARPQNPKVSRDLSCWRGYRVSAGFLDAGVVSPWCFCGGAFTKAPLSPGGCFLQKKSVPSGSLAPCSRPMWHVSSPVARCVSGRLACFGWFAPRLHTRTAPPRARPCASTCQ